MKIHFCKQKKKCLPNILWACHIANEHDQPFPGNHSLCFASCWENANFILPKKIFPRNLGQGWTMSTRFCKRKKIIKFGCFVSKWRQKTQIYWPKIKKLLSQKIFCMKFGSQKQKIITNRSLKKKLKKVILLWF